MSIPANLRNYLRLSQDRAREGHLPVYRQLAEMTLLFLVRGLGPGYYHLGRFWRREMPLRDKLRHVGERAYTQLIDRVNHPDYRKLSQHKVAEKAMLSLFGVPTPRFLGYLHVANGCTRDARPLRSGHELGELLASERPSRVCFKPVEGWGGAGFEAAEVDYSHETVRLRPLPDGEWTDADAYLRDRLAVGGDRSGRIVEEYFRQHRWLASLNPTSVNTVRVYVMVNDRGNVRFLGGILRVGRNGSLVDNVSAGGMFCPLDPETGVLEAIQYDLATEAHAAHPDSGVTVKGERLPFWPETRAMIERVSRIFPYIRFIGFDVAISDTGPAIIELNVQPDRTAACDVDLPTKDMLAP